MPQLPNQDRVGSVPGSISALPEEHGDEGTAVVLRRPRTSGLVVAQLLEDRARLRRWPRPCPRIGRIHVKVCRAILVAIAQLAVAYVVPTGFLLSHHFPPRNTA